MTDQKSFELSCSLSPHQFAVRDVAIGQNDIICTLEERGNVHVWQKEGPNKYDHVISHQVHEGMATCIEAVSGTVLNLPEQNFVSGGNDKVFRCWTPDNLAAGGTDMKTLIGHTNVVNSVTVTADGGLVTGSWDGTVKLWGPSYSAEGTIKGQHQHAVEVLGLPTGEIVTASATKSIIIYSKSGQPSKVINNAHDHVIKKLVLHPLGFASAGNDGFIKVWSNQGDPLISVAAHASSEVKFCYSVAVLPTGELVTCGEDATVKIYSADGQTLVQTLTHTGSVRAVKVLPNGDILTACADKVARIFTRDPERFASEQERKDHEDFVNMASASNMQDVDTDSLPNESVLLQPGEKDGQMKVVNVSGKGPYAYKWNSSAMSWEEIGQVMGRRKRPQINGVEYDHVTDVFVDETNASVPLGFNRDDDPIEVANKFTVQYNIPNDVRQQIIDHIRPLTDSAAVKLRQQNESKMKELTQLKHVPSWKSGGFEKVGAFKGKPFCNKIAEYNQLFIQSDQKDHVLSEEELKTVSSISTLLEDTTGFQSSSFSKQQELVVLRMLQWPNDQILPVLDVVRALMCHPGATATLGGNPSVCASLLARSASGNTHKSLVLKALANFVATRNKTPGERASPPLIPADVQQFLTEAIDKLADAVADNLPSSVVNSYVTFAYNSIVWYSRMCVNASQWYPVIATALIQACKHKLKEKPLFLALLTLGTIGNTSTNAKEMIKTNFADQLKTILQQVRTVQNRALYEVSEDVNRVFTLGL